jgi:ubiquitin-conjugating enzyme E2 variant
MIEWLVFIIVSWLAADFIAGLFHWWEDTYLTQSDSFIGRLIGGPNQLHHMDQYAFLKGSYWKRNYTTIVPSLVAMLICLAFEPLLNGWLTMLFLSQANQIHALSHSKGRNGWLVVLMQRLYIFQSPKHHSVHHRNPFHVRYCVMTPILNPVLDAVSFWRVLEFFVLAVFWIPPRLNHGLKFDMVPEDT